jgi:hypothetical protein
MWLYHSKCQKNLSEYPDTFPMFLYEVLPQSEEKWQDITVNPKKSLTFAADCLSPVMGKGAAGRESS